MASAVDFGQLESLGLTREKEPLKKKELGQEQFLELMMAQLKNQDPMKPMENGEFLSQIAQFSTVDGIQGLQESFAELSGSMVSNQALQASGLVGRTVLVGGNVGILGSEAPMTGAVELNSGADDVVVNITDTVGQQIRQFKLGPQNPGMAGFVWDGLDDKGNPMPAGAYRVEAAAFVDGKQIASETLVDAPVYSVSVGGAGGGVSLNLGAMGNIDFNDVREIR